MYSRIQGRTGAFILADSMFDMAEKEDHVDFLKHLWSMRSQRVSLVETPEQYGLAHKIVLEAYKAGLFDKKNHDNDIHPYEHNRKKKTCGCC